MKLSKHHLHWLADTTAAIITLSLAAFIGLSLLGIATPLTAIPVTWFGLYGFIVLMSATKLYGKAVYESVKSVGKGLLQLQSKKKK